MNTTVLEKPVFKTWKTIKLGTGLKTANDFRYALKESNIIFDDWGRDIFNCTGFSVESKETTLDLIIVSVSELGFETGATRKEIYKRAKEFGLDLCPAEAGPQLRLQYLDQINGLITSKLVIGMQPVTDKIDLSYMFTVIAGGDGKKFLFVIYADEQNFFASGRHFIFTHRN
jgi:hypothetical protein